MLYSFGIITNTTQFGIRNIITPFAITDPKVSPEPTRPPTKKLLVIVMFMLIVTVVTFIIPAIEIVPNTPAAY